MKQFQIVSLIESSHTNLPLGALGLPCVPWAPPNEESLQEKSYPQTQTPFSIFHFPLRTSACQLRSLAFLKTKRPRQKNLIPKRKPHFPFSIFHFEFSLAYLCASIAYHCDTENEIPLLPLTSENHAYPEQALEYPNHLSFHVDQFLSHVQSL